ncbi:Uncharacterised protein [Mycobacteroides abscessus]|uniref:helix-turn-helix transcriptional regulator n=1 Tax=Mycobacteroides abscessus TaxID=36809 RepID=UPI0005DFE5ED|nr:helix-turn-helix transcriptional regulator [Mycobacteroides abscessus]CPX20591.1 Uncharacterised protein [Mycobacteroides abscessus]CRG61220.1 Uncharacterised protein [Mycobacteroides abscessus]
MSTGTAPLAQVVGQNVKRLRAEADATQQQVASALVHLGLPWGSGRVAALEAGDVSPTLPTLVLVAAALDGLHRHSVTLVDLLAYEGRVRLVAGVEVPSSALVGVVRGGAASALAEYRRPFTVARESAVELTARETYGRTEQRAAAELGLDRERMIQLSTALWKRNLAEERDARAEQAGVTSRVERARITRQLISELSEEWAKWVGGEAEVL